jgi:anaerobic magnesium-protoporphyrin IX monomethyl ester cyclase
MAEVELVFPFELGEDRPWVLPPLGLGYLAAVLEQRGIGWGITDCTFTGIEEGLRRIAARKPSVVGIYSMVTLGRNANRMARALRRKVDFLVAGGPLPTIYPEQFLGSFDYCVKGEAEFAFADVARRLLEGSDVSGLAGVVVRRGDGDRSRRDDQNDEGNRQDWGDGGMGAATAGLCVDDLDSVPHPNRAEFPNGSYRKYWRTNFGYSPASLIATRGCPYHCDFCSRPVSGSFFRKRAVDDIIGEIKEIAALGYDHLWFADDAFTCDTQLVVDVSSGIENLRMGLKWDCLSRTDRMDEGLVNAMRRGGLERVYLGIESGSDETLRLMRKGARVEDAENALGLFSRSGVKVGGFFMIGYPGETAESIWSTVKFSARRELDYISYTVPYPLPGSPLYQRIRGSVDSSAEWVRERENAVLYDSEFQEPALKEAIQLAHDAHAIARSRGRERALEFLAAKEAGLMKKLEPAKAV